MNIKCDLFFIIKHLSSIFPCSDTFKQFMDEKLIFWKRLYMGDRGKYGPSPIKFCEYIYIYIIFYCAEFHRDICVYKLIWDIQVIFWRGLCMGARVKWGPIFMKFGRVIKTSIKLSCAVFYRYICIFNIIMSSEALFGGFCSMGARWNNGPILTIFNRLRPWVK